MDEQRLQAYMDLIGQLMWCASDEAIAVLQQHAPLLDSGLLQVMASETEQLERQGNSKAAQRLQGVQQIAAGLAAKDQSLVATKLSREMTVAGSTENSKKFLLEVLLLVADSQGDMQKVYPFLAQHQDRLTESLLQDLPEVAAFLLASNPDQSRSVAVGFAMFGTLMQQFSLGQRWLNLELSIAAYEQVLTVITQSAMPVEWARTMNDLAIAYRSRIQGDRAENLEAAFDACQQALTVRTQTSLPVEWAETMMNLALIYSERIRGDRAENIEQAIATYQQALTVRTQEAMPVEWAQTMSNLANAYHMRIQGDRAENLEQAIGCCQQALTVRTQAARPVEWAATMNNLASAYSQRIQGERAENLEQAIVCYQQVLTVRTQQAMPLEWSVTVNNLAIAYSNRIQGDRAENIERAIDYYQQALTVITPDTMPLEWARTMSNLAAVYASRIQGDRADNLEQAITACESALQVYTRDAFPEEWARTQSFLAQAYSERIRGDRAENLEQAIGYYQQALTVMTQTAMPVEWAQTMNNLANAYRNRIRGDQAENIEAAIAAYQSSLQIFTRKAMPTEWAEVMNNLAEVYLQRVRGDRADNIENATAASQQALQVRTREHLPIDWANSMTNLATAYYSRNRGDRGQNIEDAITAYEQALQVIIREALPTYWAKTKALLAKAYSERIRGDRFENLHQAIESYSQALEVEPDLVEAWKGQGDALAEVKRYDEAIASYDRALQIQPDLARAWDNRGEALEKLDRFEEAIASFDQALAIQPDVAEVWNHRGKALRSLHRFNEAIASFNRAIELKPNFYWTIANRGQAYQLLEQYEEALQDFNRAIEIDPDYIGVIAQRGETYRLMKRYEEALQDFTHTLELDSEYIWAIAQRGQTLAEMNRYEEARQDYERALAICRERGDRRNEAICLRNLGNTYQDPNERQQAIEYFQSSLRISQEISDIQNQAVASNSLGSVHASVENYSQAIEYYQQALSLYRAVSDSNNEINCLACLGNACQSLQKDQQAIECFEQVLARLQGREVFTNSTGSISLVSQVLLASSNFERAIVLAQAIPNIDERFHVLRGAVERVHSLGVAQIEELLSPLRSDPDERVHQLINEVLESIARASESTHYENLTELLQACTVKLSLPGKAGWGTGSFISPGLILTCTFVVDKSNSGSVNVLWQGQTYTAEISDMGPGGIAVLRLQQQLSLEHPCIYLSEVSEFTQPGDRLYSFGYQDDFPNGISVTFECEGLTGDDPPFLKFKSGQVRPGLGGAPLLNSRTGKICGIVSFTRDRSSNLGGDAIPAEVILSRSPDLEEFHRRFHERDKTWVNLLPPLPNLTELNRLLAQEALAERLRFCTVKLRSLNQTGWGTGYLVQSDLILAYGNVVNRAEGDSIEVDWVVQGLIKTATVEAVLPDSDLALLRIPDPLSETILLELDTNNAELDDSFYSYGYPDQDYLNGCPVTFKYAGSARDVNNLPILNLVEGQIRPGMGGAPILNLRSGKIAGIIKFTRDRASAAGGGAIPSTFILSQFPQLAQTGYESTQSPSRPLQLLTYCVFIESLQEEVALGSELEIIVSLRPFVEDQPSGYLLEISRDESLGSELNILVSAPGFQVAGGNAANLLLDLEANIQQTSQTISFHLIALRPDSSTITAEIYRGDSFETTLETTVHVLGLEAATSLETSIKTEPRPVSQPDLILQVQTLWNKTTSACTFRYHLRSFHSAPFLRSGISYQSQSLSDSWLEQLHNLLQTELETISDALPTDGRSHLTSLGHYLFQHLFPPELQADLRNLNRYQAHTLLILADQDAQFPWTLLHNGQEFLGERFIIGHWLWNLNSTQPYEFPVGAINVAHYADVEQPEVWATLLEPPGAPPPQILAGGVLNDLTATEAMRGLHLLRMGQSTADVDRQDAPVLLDVVTEEQDINQKVRPIKLNLRRNRPLVTLSYLRQDQSELTHLQQTWAATFLRSGCSAFVGTLWAVNPATEAAFVSSFYHALWIGDSLGGAFQSARRLTRAATPDSLDWLAYLLFGDPMARPYRPVQGQGYAVVEPIGQDINDPVPPDTTIRFRVSLRRTPPVWHEERVIEVAETLIFNDLQAHIVTFGLHVTPATSIPLRPIPNGNYLGWFNLSVPPDITGDSALVQVYFADGMQTIHTLTFPLKFQQEGDC